VFVVPKESFPVCFQTFDIAHYRDDEGYSDDWYDALDAGESQVAYTFAVGSGVSKGADDFLYVSAESYYDGVIPNSCTSGTYSGIYWVNPVLLIDVMEYDGGWNNVDALAYADQFNRPL